MRQGAEEIMIRLSNMEQDHFQAFMEQSIAYFAEEQIQGGNWQEEDAVQKATEQLKQLLPQGQETAGHRFFSIIAGEEQQHVGSLWIGEMDLGEVPASFIYQIIIDPLFRRQGLGKQALKALEKLSAEWERNTIWLNVFAENQGAAALYRDLGYEVIKTYRNEETGQDISCLLSKTVDE